jgi:hypothetical protein
MTTENTELQPGTILKKCEKCEVEFVTVEELAEFVKYCSPQCDGSGTPTYEEEQEEKEEE